jgi:hypothetical protein
MGVSEVRGISLEISVKCRCTYIPSARRKSPRGGNVLKGSYVRRAKSPKRVVGAEAKSKL